MFQDEAGFGRINKPKYCWCKKGIRPSVPCHHIREYRYVYGAVEPINGESCFLIMPYCNTDCMNVFLDHLSASYPDDIIVLVCDGAAWHKAKSLLIPENIRLVFIPPYTPEMNPIEQIWNHVVEAHSIFVFHLLYDLPYPDTLPSNPVFLKDGNRSKNRQKSILTHNKPFYLIYHTTKQF